jgi:hypothetical protein
MFSPINPEYSVFILTFINVIFRLLSDREPQFHKLINYEKTER